MCLNDGIERNSFALQDRGDSIDVTLWVYDERRLPIMRDIGAVAKGRGIEIDHCD